MSSMQIQPTPLTGLTLIETNSVGDDRGVFVRVFCESELAQLRPGLHFPQINLSTTYRRGSVRGMHFQVPPAAEAKLIRCVRGRVYDVAVDLRSGSPTLLRWFGIELAEGAPRQVFIPEGFAHGFQALSDNAQLLYLHTASWNRDHERGLRYDDPRLAIHWPLPITEVSARDREAPLLNDSFGGLHP